MENEPFMKRVEKTTITDWFGVGENLKESILQIMDKFPQDQFDEAFRELIREVLETESGANGETYWHSSEK